MKVQLWLAVVIAMLCMSYVLLVGAYVDALVGAYVDASERYVTVDGDVQINGSMTIPKGVTFCMRGHMLRVDATLGLNGMIRWNECP